MVGDNTRQIRLVVFLVVSCVTIALMAVRPARAAVERLLYPLERILLVAPSTSNDNPELEAENHQLKRRLESLSIEADRAVENSVLAEIISFSADPYRREVIISRGSTDGLSVGDPVLAQNSLVGVVSELEVRRATVQLVSDPLFRIVARTERDVEGLVMGEFGNLVMGRIPRDSGVQPGEAVFTTGGNGTLPTGLFIGTIRSVENDGNLLSTAFIEPLVYASDASAVSVVID